ncbi:sensor domain-containing protein [Halopseudomonas salina]|nr:sensor domain-containing diguanylate cyclase [Halopseudomonas salina]
MTTTPPLPHDKLLDLLLDVVCVVDIEGRFLSVSAASEQVFGYRPEEMIGRTAFELMHPEDRDHSLKMVEQINSGSPSQDHENRYVHKDGRIVHVMWSARWLDAEQVRVGVARDITGRKRAEAVQAALYAISEVAHAAGDLRMLYARVHQVIGKLLPADNFFVALYDAPSNQLSFPYYVDQFDPPPPSQPLDSGTLSAEVIRSGKALLLTPETAEQLLAKIGTVAGKHSLDWLGVPLIAGTEIIGALVLQSYSGDVRYNDQDLELLQFVSSQVATAIERKRTHSRLEFLAQYDQLTELPNRALFLDRLQASLTRAQRGTLRLAVLYLDMDNFKLINDTYGHSTGDLLLKEVAGRLRKCVRDSDTIGRLGGDEFAILLDNIAKPGDAAMVADKIIAALSNPYQLEGQTLISSPSLGIAIYPEHGQSEQQLVRLADEAMYVAKRSGGNCYRTAANSTATR